MMGYIFCSSVNTDCNEIVVDGDHAVMVDDRQGIVHTAKRPHGRLTVSADFFDAVALEYLDWPAPTFPVHMSGLHVAKNGQVASIDPGGRIRLMQLSARRKLEMVEEYYFPSLREALLLLPLGKHDFIAFTERGELRRFDVATREVYWSVSVPVLVPEPFSTEEFVNTSEPRVTGFASLDNSIIVISSDQGTALFDANLGAMLSPVFDWNFSDDSASQEIVDNSILFETSSSLYVLPLSWDINRHNDFSPCLTGASLQNGVPRRLNLMGDATELAGCQFGRIAPH